MTRPRSHAKKHTPEAAQAALDAHALVKPDLQGAHLLGPAAYRKLTAAFAAWQTRLGLLEVDVALAVSPISEHDHNKPSVSRTADYYWENRCD